jgi:hypothetical protein
MTQQVKNLCIRRTQKLLREALIDLIEERVKRTHRHEVKKQYFFVEARLVCAWRLPIQVSPSTPRLGEVPGADQPRLYEDDFMPMGARPQIAFMCVVAARAL